MTRSRPYVARAAYDRGKRSIIVDLSAPDGRDVALRLVDGADVVLESWRPGVAERLGLGYTELSARCPRLVYCSISGSGTDGEDVDLAGYESLVAARSGLMADRMLPGTPPVYSGVPLAGMGAGLLAVIGVGAALVARESTGRGQRVETSMFDGVLAFMTMFWESLEHLPDASAPSALAPSRRLLVGSFICGDGEYLGVHTGANGSHARLMTALGLADRVPPAPGNREKTVPLSPEEQEAILEVPEIFASQPARTGRNGCAPPTSPRSRSIARPRSSTRRRSRTTTPPFTSTTPSWVSSSRSAWPRVSPAPRERSAAAHRCPARHSDEILHALGYDADAIDRLRRSEIIG